MTMLQSWLQITIFICFSVCLNAAVFPPIEGKALSGDSIRIPSGNGYQLLIMGFDMDSAPLMKDWVVALQEDLFDAIDWFQIAMIGKVPPFVNGFIVRGIRSSVPTDIHDRFLPYFGNISAIEFVLSDGKEMGQKELPFIVVLDEERSIQYQFQGIASSSNIQHVQSAIIDILGKNI